MQYFKDSPRPILVLLIRLMHDDRCSETMRRFVVVWPMEENEIVENTMCRVPPCLSQDKSSHRPLDTALTPR